MKTALYAFFALLSISLLPPLTPDAQAFIFGKRSKPAEVEERSSDEEDEQTQAPWFWQREEEVVVPAPRVITTPHIALLLPLTGQYASAAQAVQEGFISAYYQNQQTHSGTQIDIKIYDTVADQDVKHAYATARAQGANMIVGPLTKPGLEALLQSQQIDNSIPTIALNTTDLYPENSSQWYEFSLNPEDEARRLAEQAIAQGHYYALGLVQDDAFGTRVLMAFNRRLQELGGQVIDVVYFDPNRALEDPVRYALGTDLSEERAQKLKRTLGRSIESQTSHRSDIDFVFLVAKPQQARQIPPLMKFYYAQDLPIYATSTVYTGIPNKSLDGDLNGVVFCDSPWIINPEQRDPNLNATANQLLTDPATQERLFALGVDAFAVTKQVSTLRSPAQFGLSGVTGNLQMDEYGRVMRSPACARFNQGVPHVL